MNLHKILVKQISSITEQLIISSFSIRENYVAHSEGDIYWSGYKNIAFTLKKQPYDVIYEQCIKEKAYNFILLDNALIQMMYRIVDNQIVSHRLAYLPHPNFLNYQDSPEDFEELFYGNELFTDIIEKRVLTVPIRFDFDVDNLKHVEFDHAKSHITLGNYKNCRIPATKPITPNRFMLFVLRSFYFDRFIEYYTNRDFRCNIAFEDCITDNERELLYVST